MADTAGDGGAFPERAGAARRARPGDLFQAFLVALGGWAASLPRSRAGRVLLGMTLGIAGLGTTGLGMRSGLSLTVAWVVLAAVGPPATAAALVVWPGAGAFGYVLPGAAGEPALVSVLGLRRQRDGSWLVENHNARRVGRGWGGRLRAQIGPGIRRTLDADGAVLRVGAAGADVAALYAAGFVGDLERVPASGVDRWLGRVRLERHPIPDPRPR